MENLTITLLVAIAENGVIGVNNSLPWHISDDLKRFKAITTGHSIIMGRKTYESFPKRPLPNRKNIVLSNSCKEIEGAFVAKDINEALKLCDSQEVFIIGGATIYEQFIDIA
ncbi:MAG: dihydrofolate reductase, partial [Bacteroidales bacterium]|nr:dihydrofolate reductase [Bacteroidales bacterium]